MSQFVASAPTPVGATKPIQPGGTLSYTNNTKPSAYANEDTYASYGFSSYNTPPPDLKERSGHYSVVTIQPDDKRMDAPLLDDIFTPSNKETAELTNYFLNRLPAEQKSLSATRTIKQYGLQDLLTKYLQKELQEDAERVKARYAGATAVEAELASARLQNRFSDMIRYYGSEQQLREALLRDVVGGIPEASVRGAAAAALRREMAEGGAGAFPVDADAPAGAMPVEGGAVAAEAADAMDSLESGAREREDVALEGDSLEMAGEIQEEITRIEERLRDLYTRRDIQAELMETEQTGAAIDRASDDFIRIDADITELEGRLGELRAELISSGAIGRGAAAAASVTGGSGMGGSAASDSVYTGFGRADDGAAAYAPGGSVGSMKPPLPTGSGTATSFEFTEPGAPAGTTGRPLVGEVLGHESASAPARAMATADPAAAGSTARQDMFSRRAARGGRRDEMRRAMEAAVMGMEMEEEDEPVDTVKQNVHGQDTRRQ